MSSSTKVCRCLVYLCIQASDFQATLLSYLAQEALAHAALIFATLAAAFTFATGFKKTLSKHQRVPLYVYGGILFVLFLVAVYALLRFILYAGLTEFLLTLSRPPSCNDTFTSYWTYAVRNPAENHTSLLVPISGLYNVGLSGVVIACFLAYLLAFFTTLLASGLLSIPPRRSLFRVWTLAASYLIYLIAFSTVVAIPIPENATYSGCLSLSS